MQPTYTVAPLLHSAANLAIPSSFLYLYPRVNHHRLHLALKPNSLSFSTSQSHPESFYLVSLHRTHNPNGKDQQSPEPSQEEARPHPHPKDSPISQLHSFSGTGAAIGEDPGGRNPGRGGGKGEKEGKPPRKGRGIFSNMWWADLKAAVGQRINVEGIVSSVGVLVNEPHLALPHVRVRDIRYIDWEELRRSGFMGVVFDKDNTITAPYSLVLWGHLGSSMEQCKSVFRNDIAVFSNSAGLQEYDHDGRKAWILEKAIGIKVIRHGVKKPAGTAEEIERHFGCKSSQLIMVGDRPFTDIVYGNRNGFLTVLTDPLSIKEEPFVIRQVRKLEVALLNYWLRRGIKPIPHTLLADATRCIKDPPPL